MVFGLMILLVILIKGIASEDVVKARQRVAPNRKRSYHHHPWPWQKQHRQKNEKETMEAKGILQQSGQLLQKMMV